MFLDRDRWRLRAQNRPRGEIGHLSPLRIEATLIKKLKSGATPSFIRSISPLLDFYGFRNISKCIFLSITTIFYQSERHSWKDYHSDWRCVVLKKGMLSCWKKSQVIQTKFMLRLLLRLLKIIILNWLVIHSQLVNLLNDWVLPMTKHILFFSF